MARMCGVLLRAGRVPFGFGGNRQFCRDGILPVPAELMLAAQICTKGARADGWDARFGSCRLNGLRAEVLLLREAIVRWSTIARHLDGAWPTPVEQSDYWGPTATPSQIRGLQARSGLA